MCSEVTTQSSKTDMGVLDVKSVPCVLKALGAGMPRAGVIVVGRGPGRNPSRTGPL